MVLVLLILVKALSASFHAGVLCFDSSEQVLPETIRRLLRRNSLPACSFQYRQPLATNFCLEHNFLPYLCICCDANFATHRWSPSRLECPPPIQLPLFSFFLPCDLSHTPFQAKQIFCLQSLEKFFLLFFNFNRDICL